jgi:thiol:disulfide interchange protein
MLTQTIAFLASGALFALAIALLLAGRSLWLVARTVIGWSAAVLSTVLALTAFALLAFHYITDQAPPAPVSGALGVGGALVIAGLATKVARHRRPARSAAKPRQSRPTTKPRQSSSATAAAPSLTGAARDAIAALVTLGLSKGEAASAVAAVAASLGGGADTPALVKAALRARNL